MWRDSLGRSPADFGRTVTLSRHHSRCRHQSALVATEYSVTNSVINAMKIVNDNQFQSVAFPLIGSGSGNRGKAWSLEVMCNAFEKIESQAPRG